MVLYSNFTLLHKNSSDSLGHDPPEEKKTASKKLLQMMSSERDKLLQLTEGSWIKFINILFKAEPPNWCSWILNTVSVLFFVLFFYTVYESLTSSCLGSRAQYYRLPMPRPVGHACPNPVLPKKTLLWRLDMVTKLRQAFCKASWIRDFRDKKKEKKRSEMSKSCRNSLYTTNMQLFWAICLKLQMHCHIRHPLLLPKHTQRHLSNSIPLQSSIAVFSPPLYFSLNTFSLAYRGTWQM